MKQEKRAKIKELAGRLAALTPEQKLELSIKCGVCNPDGHQLSVINNCLLHFQTEGTDRIVTVVAGYKQWKRSGRQVMKGQHGLMIWVPSVKEDDETGEESVSFYPATVFDISQTMDMAEAKQEVSV